MRLTHFYIDEKIRRDFQTPIELRNPVEKKNVSGQICLHLSCFYPFKFAILKSPEPLNVNTAFDFENGRTWKTLCYCKLTFALKCSAKSQQGCSSRATSIITPGTI